ncbi:MAG: FecR family protein [Woeseiaceae bacterium]|nr:FecR family protein [Woeseiaceae bacterium]
MTNHDDNESLARLMKLAGERPEIPLSVESRVYHHVQQEWQKATIKPNGDKVYEEVHRTWRRGSLRAALLRWTLPLGIAAAAAIALFVMPPMDVPPLQVAATVSRIVGTGPLSSSYSEGAPVYSGEVISTAADEGLSLLLARSESLRIDANTQIRIDAADRFTLLAGRVYADSGQFVYREGGLKIETGFGSVTDVGTQFSVSASDERLEVAVREGRVDVHSQNEDYAARVGERLTLTAGGPALVTDIDTNDVYWDWVADLAPTLDLTNISLLDFLKWAARETGRDLQFENDESRMFAMRTDVHGSVNGLTPDEALVSILATTTVRYKIENDRIIIEHQSQ